MNDTYDWEDIYLFPERYQCSDVNGFFGSALNVDEVCQVDDPFKVILPTDFSKGAECEVYPDGFSPQLIGDLEDYTHLYDVNGFSSGEWRFKMKAFPRKKIQAMSRTWDTYKLDWDNPIEVIFNSNSYWSECGRFKRKKFI